MPPMDGTDPESPPAEMTNAVTSWDVRETRIRLPRKAVHELKRMADAKGISMNAVIAGYIDAGLRSDGRRGIHDLAPWFMAYLRRKGGHDGLADRPTASDDDFT